MTGSRLAALLDQATPGPWTLGYPDGSGRGEDDDGIYVRAEHQDLSDNKAVVRAGQDDWGLPHGVMREPDARLIALAPDMARLLVDMADRLIEIRSFYGHLFSTDELANDGEMLARFAALDEKAGAARGCAACDGDPEAHGLHVCGKEFGA